MNVKYFIHGLVVLAMLLWACEKDYTNPILSDADLTIFEEGSGGNIKGRAWEGYDVFIGESMELKLQVSPAEGTTTRWVKIDEDGVEELISTDLNYTFDAEEEGSERVYFIADRETVSDTVVANFNAIEPGTYVSRINDWQTIPFDSMQTGIFAYEFDMIPAHEGIDCVTGLTNVGAVNAYDNLSALVRFKDGIIDAFDDIGYAHQDELEFEGGATYHVRMSVDVFKKEYSVFVTDPEGTLYTIARKYKFRKKSSNLTGMAIVAGDYLLDNPGTHRVMNITLESISQNFKPSFDEVDDILMIEGAAEYVSIKATDPFGGNLTLTGVNLPRYASFEETGNGEGLLSLNPYDNCSKCDAGEVTIEIVASSSLASNTLRFNVNVIAAVKLTADLADADIWFGPYANDPPNVNPWRSAPELFIGGGVNWQNADDQYDQVAIIPFQIPPVPAGQQFTYAVLGVNTIAEIGPYWFEYDIDLYGLPYRSLPRVDSTDHYQGNFGEDMMDYAVGDYGGATAKSTPIQQGWATANTKQDALLLTSDGGNINLVDYLNAQLALGAKEGDYVFLRVNPDVLDAPDYGRIRIVSADGGDKAPYLLYIVE